MTESSSPSGGQSTILPLISLQEILHNSIIQKKGEIHESHNRAFNERIWAEIENIAMGIGSNTYSAATITGRIITKVYHRPIDSIFLLSIFQLSFPSLL
ncbi:MAG: hypothetical protein M3156_02850 [Thermoproteota archaeon]|nr:hypothetical protein [Thermoproteota archaeon]